MPSELVAIMGPSGAGMSTIISSTSFWLFILAVNLHASSECKVSQIKQKLCQGQADERQCSHQVLPSWFCIVRLSHCYPSISHIQNFCDYHFACPHSYKISIAHLVLQCVSWKLTLRDGSYNLMLVGVLADLHSFPIREPPAYLCWTWVLIMFACSTNLTFITLIISACAMTSFHAGKSTMLDILAGKNSGKGLTGSVTLNGEPINPHLANRCISYVGQEDVFMPMLTVWECLLFVAELSAQASSKVQRDARMNLVLNTLGLGRIKNSKVSRHLLTPARHQEKQHLHTWKLYLSEDFALFCQRNHVDQSLNLQLRVFKVCHLSLNCCHYSRTMLSFGVEVESILEKELF